MRGGQHDIMAVLGRKWIALIWISACKQSERCCHLMPGFESLGRLPTAR